MQVFQTSGAPPARGRIILASIGCTRKSSPALTNNVTPKHQTKTPPPGINRPEAQVLKLRVPLEVARALKPEAQAKERLAIRRPSLALQASLAGFPAIREGSCGSGMRLAVAGWTGIPRLVLFQNACRR